MEEYGRRVGKARRDLIGAAEAEPELGAAISYLHLNTKLFGRRSIPETNPPHNTDSIISMTILITVSA